jgi:Protein of unknown function (DUF2510)
MATLVEGQSRSKRKKLAQARKIAGPSTEVAAYGSGIGHSRAPRTLLYIAIGYVVAFLAFRILLGRLLFPGILVLVVVYYLIRPLRGVAVTPVGILVMHESMVNGQPTKVLYFAPRDAIGSFDEHLERRRHVKVKIGPELIRIKRNVYESLLVAVQRQPSVIGPTGSFPVPPWPPPGWFSDPSARYQYRYWDGQNWTAHASQYGINYFDPLT